MNSTMFLTFVLICGILWGTCSRSVALSCDSCGRECASACGTRHFRTCCFNYLRKRSGPTAQGLKVELRLAPSRDSLRRLEEIGILRAVRAEPVIYRGEDNSVEPRSRLQLIYDA